MTPGYTNRDAERFCKNLRASIGGWKMQEDTYKFYLAKLSKWTLSSDGWARVLDRVIADNTSGDLPPLSKIYDYIKAEQSLRAHDETPSAHFCFRLQGSSYAARVWNDSGVWRLMRVRKETDSRDWVMERTSIEFHAPAGAEDVHLALPDDLQARQDDLVPIPF